MTRYAENTSVSVESSRAEIERTLQRYNAESFAYGWAQKRALIEFTHEARKNQHKAWEQACRQRWRALALAIKAKLEAVEAGITTFEDEFMAHIVLPDGSTFGSWARPQIAKVYELNAMPALLPGAEAS